MSTTSSMKKENAHFESEAREALFRIQTALADLLNRVPDHPQNPNDLRRTLGIDKSLAWKVSKAVEERDPFAVAPFLPGEAGQEILLRAASRMGAPEQAIDAVRAARKLVDQIIERHAGDRPTFELMLAGHNDLFQSRAGVLRRKEAFRSDSLVWGVQAKVQYKASFFHPSAQPGMADVARVRGFVGFRRIRRGVPWTIARVSTGDDRGGIQRTPGIEPLDSAAESRTPLMREFCSKPLPRFEERVDPDGTVCEVLLDAPVGNTGSMTCFTGDVLRAAGSLVRDADNRYTASVMRLRTPCAIMLFDLFVHHSLLDGEAPEFAVYGELDSRPWPACDERERLPLNVEVERTGRGAFAARTKDVPRCAELARSVFDRTGWPEREFNLFRVRLEYPPLPVSAVMRYELPENA